MATAIPGLYAVGDLRQHSARQVLAAAGDGATAACFGENVTRSTFLSERDSGG
jgi:thioredoxin reductase